MPSLDLGSAAAIVAMAAATALTRVGGYWLMGQVTPGPRVRRMLEALPGSVVAAIVLPIAVKNGASAMLAVATVGAVAVASRNELLAVAAGLLVAIAARRYGL